MENGSRLGREIRISDRGVAVRENYRIRTTNIISVYAIYTSQTHLQLQLMARAEGKAILSTDVTY